MKYTAMVKELEDHRAKILGHIEQKVKDAFKTVSSSCFSNNPDLYAIHWDQYTPYFNDGDECIFRIGEIFAIYEGGREQFEEGAYDVTEDIEDAESVYRTSSRADDESPGREALLALSDLLHLDPDIMQSLFGNHVEVTLTYVDGEVVVRTDECDHD